MATLVEKNVYAMFQARGTDLQKLPFVSCSKGHLGKELPLVLSAGNHPNLSHMNERYTHAVHDQTVIALVISAFGAQQIITVVIQRLMNYHKNTLRRAQLFECFRMKWDAFEMLGRYQDLSVLAFGHLRHLPGI